MKQFFQKYLLYLLFIFIALVMNVFPGLLEDSVKSWLKTNIGANYLYLVVVVVIIAIVFPIKFADKNKKQDIAPEILSPEQVISPENLEKIRNGLLDSYKERWDKKLADRLPMNLKVKYSRKGTSPKAPLDKTVEGKKIKEEIAQVFDKCGGRLLIIGEPGSGKTSLTLSLAIKILEEAPQEGRIPIVVNIATWQKRPFKTVADWLLELLPEMGFSRPLVEQLLKKNLLLPLFDGLDELAKGQRKNCLKAIKRFGKQHPKAKYVICSRIKEYAAINIDAAVYNQVMVLPLTVSQIGKALKNTKTPASNRMLAAIKQDSHLAKAIRTPFYCNTAQLLFAENNWEDFGFVTKDDKKRKEELVAAFVKTETSSFKNYTAAETPKYLGFLAKRMNEKGLVSFELLSLQYDWTTLNRRQGIVANYLNRLTKNLVIGLLGGLIVGLLFGIIFGLIVGLLFGIIGGLIVGLIGGLADINTHKEKTTSIRLKDNWFGIMVFGLFGGLLGGLIFGIIVGLLSANLGKDISIQAFQKAFQNNWEGILAIGLLFGLLGGLLFGLLGGLLFGLLGGLLGGLSSSKPSITPKEVMPWSSAIFLQSLKTHLVESLLGGLLLGLLLGLLVGLLGGLYDFIREALTDQYRHNQSYLQITHPYQRFDASKRSGDFSIWQHHHLCGILHQQGLLLQSKDLVGFLDDAVVNHILESDGGSWRFRHRILQDYFAVHHAPPPLKV